MTNFELFDDIHKNKPKNYIVMIQKGHKEIWDAVVRHNEMYHFGKIPKPQMFYNWRYDVKEWPKCIVCGKPALFAPQYNFKYSVCCSKKCFGKSDYRMDLYRKTCLLKYGHENAFSNDEVKRKIAETNIKKYGERSYLKTKECREKAKRTNLEKYGNESPARSEIVKEKRRKTCLERYGVEYASQAKEVKEKARNTQILRYGSFGGWMTDEVKNKMISARKDTLLKTYGTSKNPKTIQKLADATRNKHERFVASIPNMFPDYDLMDETWIKKSDKHTWKCKKCGNVFIRAGFPRCLDCHPVSTSIDQEELFNYVKSFCPDAIQNDRSILPSKKELDIYIPSLHMGIEYNGLFWHCEESGKGKHYHLDKTNEALSVGVRLIQIFSDEWLDPVKKKIIKWKLQYMFGKMPFKSIFARKCEARPISYTLANKFHEKYHIQGGNKSKVNIGLFYHNRIVAVGSFQPTGKDGVFQLSRYSTIFTKSVVGGLGKIISNFAKNNNDCKKIITFADRRYSNGHIYKKLGFSEVGFSGPYYWYTRNYKTRLHRFRLRKTRLSMWDISYDENWTERQLAKANAYSRIWDCGQIKFELTLS